MTGKRSYSSRNSSRHWAFTSTQFFQKFEPVEGWVELALTTFLYLESYRVQRMAHRDLRRGGETLVEASADVRSVPGGPVDDPG